MYAVQITIKLSKINLPQSFEVPLLVHFKKTLLMQSVLNILFRVRDSYLFPQCLGTSQQKKDFNHLPAWIIYILFSILPDNLLPEDKTEHIPIFLRSKLIVNSGRCLNYFLPND